MTSEIETVKVLVVGDDDVGKSCLVFRQTRDIFPELYTPKVAEGLCTVLPYQDRQITMCIWDMSRRPEDEDFIERRPLSYPGTNTFLLCFSIASRSSFENVAKIWLPELKKHAHDVPVILVGLKTDLRSKEEDVKDENVNISEGLKLSEDIKAVTYLECSSLTGEGVRRVFEEALLSSVCSRERKHTVCCFVI